MKKIVTRIREVAEARGITTAYQLQKSAGLSSSMAARLYRDEVGGIQLSTMNALCDALACEPGDLFVRVGGTPSPAPPAKKVVTSGRKRGK